MCRLIQNVPELLRTSEISLAPSRGRILYAIYGNSTCVINHIVVTAIDKRYRNYYVSTLFWGLTSTGISLGPREYSLVTHSMILALEPLLFKIFEALMPLGAIFEVKTRFTVYVSVTNFGIDVLISLLGISDRQPLALLLALLAFISSWLFGQQLAARFYWQPAAST